VPTLTEVTSAIEEAVPPLKVAQASETTTAVADGLGAAVGPAVVAAAAEVARRLS